MNIKNFVMKKKAQISSIISAVIAFVVMGIVVAVGMSILGQTKTTVTDGNATAAIATVISSTNTMVGFLPIVAIALIGGVVIFLVMRYFGGKGSM